MKRTRRNPSSSYEGEIPKPKRMLSSSELLVAAKEAFRLAAESPAAICGGYALQLFGSPRMTTDIDFMATEPLPVRKVDTLSFGGYEYKIKGIRVDWIMRDDEQARVYDVALRDRMLLKGGLYVIRPEWMAIIKLLARRYRDIGDLMYILRTPRLADRKRIIYNIREVLGEGAFATVDEMRGAFDEADLGRAKDRDDREYEKR